MAAAANRSLEARLTRKVGPLPVWAWAASIIALYLLYTRLHKAAPASTADTTAVPAATGNNSAQVPASGQGAPVDNLNQSLFDSLGANTAAIDQLTQQLLQTVVASDPGLPQDTPQGAPTPAPGPAATPTPAPVAKQPQVHQTQTTAGVLTWGGVNFHSRAAFDTWAKQHGTSSAQIFRSHPQAKTLYSTLQA